jgi:twitching motility protein PilT
MLIDKLLITTINQGASDLHLNAGRKPLIRVDGAFVELDTKVLEAKDTAALMKQFTPESGQTHLQEEGSCDFSFPFQGARFRVNICRAQGNLKLALRRLPSKLLTPEQIGFPRQVLDLLQRVRGLFLVTGPTGSGKTTTLASLVTHISQTADRHIIMIERPTEYVLDHGNCLVTQREVDTDVRSFEAALIDALREDPDVIVVGEMRDRETIRTAVSAAETGHLVLATLHTSSAPKTINRLLDSFPIGEREEVRSMLSTSLLGVLCQQLIPRLDHKGRVAAFEFMAATPSIANKIRQDQVHTIDSDIQTGAKLGMQQLDDHLAQLVTREQIDRREALVRANNPLELIERLQRRLQ